MVGRWGLPIVPSGTYLAPDRAQDIEDGPDERENHAERVQQRNPDEEAEEDQDDACCEHVLVVPTFRWG